VLNFYYTKLDLRALEETFGTMKRLTFAITMITSKRHGSNMRADT
jgi:hypothetical protein